jgi:hypothetical protein
VNNNIFENSKTWVLDWLFWSYVKLFSALSRLILKFIIGKLTPSPYLIFGSESDGKVY